MWCASSMSRDRAGHQFQKTIEIVDAFDIHYTKG
jgi:hypothetical protein